MLLHQRPAELQISKRVFLTRSGGGSLAVFNHVLRNTGYNRAV
tara:strand:+ start:807 stop:935 length:129 start_codon:yes stop_codon:yes gene_type:complete